MKQCKPIQCQSVESPSEVRRFLFCKQYEACLDYAVKKDWDNFTCEQCECYERIQWSDEQWAEDSERCLTLAYFIAFAEVKRQLEKTRRGISQAPVAPYLLQKPQTAVELS